MTTLNKTQVQSNIIKISQLGKQELIKEAQNISLADIDDKSRSFLNRALDLRLAELQGIDVSGLVVCSDIRADEVGL